MDTLSLVLLIVVAFASVGAFILIMAAIASKILGLR